MFDSAQVKWDLISNLYFVYNFPQELPHHLSFMIFGK